MKKKTQKILGLLLLLTIVFSSLGMAYPKEYYAFEQETGISPKVQAQMDLQQHALDAYEVLYENLQPKTRSAQVSSYNVVYDEDYGGEYIDGDRLVLLLVGRNKEMEEKYSDLCGNSSYIRFADAQYSLNELNGLKPLADELMLEYGIVSHGVDVRNNRYHIGVIEDDYDTLLADERLSERLDRFSITVEEGAQACASSLYGGDKLRNSNGISFSLCIGGTYEGRDCILTCGHGNEGFPIIYRGSSSTVVGNVVFQRANQSEIPGEPILGLGDYAIVQLNSNFTGTNKVRNATTLLNIKGVYSSVPVGTTIYKYGATTGYSSGHVTAIAQTVHYQSKRSDYYVGGLTLSYVTNSSGTAALAEGDSGGCVYIKDGSIYKIHGNVTAQFENTGNMYSTPIYYAQYVGFEPDTN